MINGNCGAFGRAVLAAVAVAMGMNGAARGDEGLVLHEQDLACAVGTKCVYAFTNADGSARGEAVRMVTANLQLGDQRLVKWEGAVNGHPLPVSWRLSCADGLHVFRDGAMDEADVVLPMPLAIGSTWSAGEGESARTLRVVKEETITVPAGTFGCLVCEVAIGGATRETLWIAPVVGVVQMKDGGANGMTTVLVSIHKPAPADSSGDTVTLADFDAGSAASALFPKAQLSPYVGNAEGVSLVTIDSTTGAGGSAMSLRWSYHTKGECWVQAGVLLSGSWQEPVDLMPFDSISFQIKGFRPGRCAFMIHAKPAREGADRWVNLPIEYGTTWSTVTIDLSRDELSALDLHRAAQVGLGALGGGVDGNVVWIDQITCHRRAGEARSE